MISLEEVLENPEYILALERKRFLYYKPHDKQAEFHKLGSICKERLFLAGNRVGKTYCGATEVAMHLTGNYPSWWKGKRFKGAIEAWAASNTTESTRDILQSEYIGNEKTGKVGAIHPSLIVSKSSRRGVADAVDTVFIQHVGGAISQLGFKSYDQGRAKFQGTHRHIIHLDEEPSVEIYEECLLRTMGTGDKEPGVILMTMTPLGGMTSLLIRFLENMVSGEPRDGRAFIQAGWEDNKFLDDAERVQLRKSFSSRPHELEAREKGTPAIGSGMIFPISESEIVCEPFEIPKNYKRCFGLDFGWTNPTAAVFIAHNPDTDISYIYAEYAKNELPPQTHVNNLNAMGADWIPAVADPAGQSSSQKDGISLMETYRKHGLDLGLANNKVETGLQEVYEKMLNGKLKIFRTCDKTLSELRMYARDDKGKVKKMNDHLMDALRYAIVSGLPEAVIKETKVAQDARSLYNRQSTATSWMGG